MDATINRDARAALLVTERAQHWRGRLKLTPELTGHTANGIERT